MNSDDLALKLVVQIDDGSYLCVDGEGRFWTTVCGPISLEAYSWTSSLIGYER